jgi:hypothetical protein
MGPVVFRILASLFKTWFFMDMLDCGKPYHLINNTNLHTKGRRCKRKTALSLFFTNYGTPRKITGIPIGYYLL